MSTRTNPSDQASRSTSGRAKGGSPAPPVAQRDVVYHALREALVLQVLAAGEKLSEPAWCERLSVSRTAVREAFARLEAEGLIEKAAKAGYVVPHLSAEDLKEITEVRLALECAAIERLCEAPPALRADLTPLRAACDQQARFLEEGYKLGAREADRRFHQEIINLAGNRRLSQMYRRAPLPLIHRSMATPSPSRPTGITVAEHRRIVDAIARGDAAQARTLLREHLIEGLTHLND